MNLLMTFFQEWDINNVAVGLPVQNTRSSAFIFFNHGIVLALSYIKTETVRTAPEFSSTPTPAVYNFSWGSVRYKYLITIGAKVLAPYKQGLNDFNTRMIIREKKVLVFVRIQTMPNSWILISQVLNFCWCDWALNTRSEERLGLRLLIPKEVWTNQLFLIGHWLLVSMQSQHWMVVHY